MRVAVVIPTFNGAQFIVQTIAGIQAQTLSHWELIVVDDGSTDDTPQIVNTLLQSDRRIRMVQQSNGGIACARNRGLAECSASSEYVTFVDHDDLLQPNALAHLCMALDAETTASAAHGLVRTMDSAGVLREEDPVYEKATGRMTLTQFGVSPLSPAEPTTFASEAYYHTIQTVGQVMFRKAVVLAVGGFDFEAVPCDDWYLYLRILLRGDMVFIPEVVVWWRQHEGNTSNVTAKMRMGELIVCCKIAVLYELHEPFRTWALKCMLLHSLEETRHCLKSAASNLVSGHPNHALRFLQWAKENFKNYLARKAAMRCSPPGEPPEFVVPSVPDT